MGVPRGLFSCFLGVVSSISYHYIANGTKWQGQGQGFDIQQWIPASTKKVGGGWGVENVFLTFLHQGRQQRTKDIRGNPANSSPRELNRNSTRKISAHSAYLVSRDPFHTSSGKKDNKSRKLDDVGFKHALNHASQPPILATQ